MSFPGPSATFAAVKRALASISCAAVLATAAAPASGATVDPLCPPTVGCPAPTVTQAQPVQTVGIAKPKKGKKKHGKRNANKGAAHR